MPGPPPLSVPVTWTEADGHRPGWARLLAPAQDSSLVAAVAFLAVLLLVLVAALARNVSERSVIGIALNLLFLAYVVVGYARRVLTLTRS